MTIKELIKELAEYPEDTVVDFKLMPKKPFYDDDRDDKQLDYIGEIGTSGLDSDYPYIEIGFKLD